MGLPFRLAAFAALLFLPAAALAQAFPGKTVRIVIPFPAGGPSDANARILAQHLTERWGQQVIVDSRPGGNTVIGTEIVARSAPDGYTLLLTSVGYSAAPVIQARLPYDPLVDLAPITIVSMSPQAIAAHPSLPVKNVKELVALARAKPGALNLGNVDPSTQIVGLLFCQLAGVKIEAVPYKGGAPMMVDLMGGHVHLGVAAMSTLQIGLKTGRVRLLGIGSQKPFALYPDAPLISADVPGFDAIAWFGLLAPGKTPKDVISRIHKEVASVLQLPDVKQKLMDLGSEPGGQTPEEFAARIRTEIARFQKVAKAAGMRPQ